LLGTFHRQHKIDEALSDLCVNCVLKVRNNERKRGREFRLVNLGVRGAIRWVCGGLRTTGPDASKYLGVVVEQKKSQLAAINSSNENIFVSVEDRWARWFPIATRGGDSN
jgi:hypothetical protein